MVTLPAFLTPILSEHLDSFIHPGSDALVFATRSGRPLARSNWSATFHRATAALGLAGAAEGRALASVRCWS